MADRTKPVEIPDGLYRIVARKPHRNGVIKLGDFIDAVKEWEHCSSSLSLGSIQAPFGGKV